MERREKEQPRWLRGKAQGRSRWSAHRRGEATRLIGSFWAPTIKRIGDISDHVSGLVGFRKIRKSGNIVKGDTNTKRSWWVSQGWVPTWQAYLAWQTGKCLKEESLDEDERKEADTPTCWKTEMDLQQQQLIPWIFKLGWALTQRSDRLSATVFKRKTVITRPRTYLDLHHMSLRPAQMRSLPLGVQLS